jgi:hypothetical protein
MAREIEMKVTILTGTDDLNLSLERYLYFVFSEQITDIFNAKLGQPETMRPEMLSSQLWIAEAFNPEDINNPEGFRTVKKFAGNTHSLLLFSSDTPETFPADGSFWLTIPSKTSLSGKIRQIIEKLPPTIEEFQQLERLCPVLKGIPTHHHHNVSATI